MKATYFVLALVCAVCGAADRPPPWSTTEILDEAVVPFVHGNIETSRILAWHSEGYDDPPKVKVECVLVWVQLRLGEKGPYALVRAVRNPAQSLRWTPDFIAHGRNPVEYFWKPPTSDEIVAFARPWFGPARAGARLYDASILKENWRLSTGEDPQIAYK